MGYVYYFFVFVAGTFFGSFLNLVSDRIITGETILTGRSKCDHCNKPLEPGNLIPVLSYILQKGKCGFCAAKLALYYPLSEILAGLLLVFSAYKSGLFQNYSVTSLLMFVYLSVSLYFFLILFLTDAKYSLLPDKIVFSAVFFVLFSIILLTAIDLFFYYNQLAEDSFGKYLLQAGLWDYEVVSALRRMIILLISSFSISAFFLFLIFITKGRGMGGGDVKLGFLIGLFNGFPNNILAIFLGFLFGAVFSLMLIALKRKTIKDVIPFGPFLIMGSLVALNWGNEIMNWYFNLF
ncbi:prepilin peptidase [candidate division WWE3 bacterium]|jgi:leader peptidase (prepilin peptidase)/N-methyltransferase|uniref:Prepilin peptidase n=1 Tax=candidate division WWE3 bacterium TaxID=2053526 RepID=A0A3A4ZAF2_UNCKA|nr:MAG: prepilin peptidase [candidate division WWE3 bacterium]